MTTKISIKNFQSIKDASFEVDGFTVIVGKNNIGKSAVVRAVEAALTNQTGQSFIRYSEKKTTVNIKRDNIDIQWDKGTSATYTIKKGEEKEVYTKLNRDIPQPLIDAGFEKMEIGDKKVFPLIASQFDPLFLVDKPGSVVTEVLASLYKIDTLSKADDLCQKALKSQKSMLKTRETDLKVLQTKLEAFVDFDEIKKTVIDLVKKEEETENLRSEIIALKGYEKNVNNLAESLSVLRNITTITVPKSKGFEKALNEVQQLGVMEKSYLKLSGIVLKLKNVPKLNIPKVTKINTLAKEVSLLCQWDDTAKELIGNIKQQKEVLDNFNMKKINTTAKKVEKAFKELKDTRVLEESFTEVAAAAKGTREDLKAVTEALKQKKSEMGEMKVCPLCERPL